MTLRSAAATTDTTTVMGAATMAGSMKTEMGVVTTTDSITVTKTSTGARESKYRRDKYKKCRILHFLLFGRWQFAVSLVFFSDSSKSCVDDQVSLLPFVFFAINVINIFMLSIVS